MTPLPGPEPPFSTAAPAAAAAAATLADPTAPSAHGAPTAPGLYWNDGGEARSDAMSLEVLFKRARAGEPDAKDELYRCVHGRLRAAVHRELERHLRASGHPVVALLSTWDVVQEVFQEVLRSLEQLEITHEEAFFSLLVTMCKHRLLDQIRRYQAARRDVRRHAGEAALEAEPDGERTPLDKALRAEQVQIYRDVLATFAPRQRILLELRFEVGESFPEIAKKLGFPTADAARKACHDAHTRLVLALRRRGVRADGSTTS